MTPETVSAWWVAVPPEVYVAAIILAVLWALKPRRTEAKP